MESARCYEACTGRGPGRSIICWGLSRFGEKHDGDMQNAVLDRAGPPGSGTAFYVTITPAMPRLHSPERIAAQRVRNMKARAAKLPLLAPLIEQEEMKREYFSLEEAERSVCERRAFHESRIADFWKKHAEELRVKLP